MEIKEKQWYMLSDTTLWIVNDVKRARQARNDVNCCISKDKYRSTQKCDQIIYSDDSKQWKQAKEMTNLWNKEHSNEIIENGKCITNTKEIVNYMNRQLIKQIEDSKCRTSNWTRLYKTLKSKY